MAFDFEVLSKLSIKLKEIFAPMTNIVEQSAINR